VCARVSEREREI